MRRIKDTIIICIFVLIVSLIVPDTLSQQCGFKQFRCSDGTCLTTEKLCNSIEECPEGEDETGNENYDCTRQTLASAKCRKDEFQCRFGECIPENKLCDSVPDCWGGADESIEFCSRRPGYKPPVGRPAGGGGRPAPAPQSTTRRPIPRPPRPTTTERPTTPQIVQQQPRPSRPPALLETPRTVRTTSTTAAPQRPTSSDGCRPLDIPDGQSASCFNEDHIINCTEKPSPVGTNAKISCKRYWRPPPTGSRTTERTCEGGQWVGGNRRFRCDLECGDGGYPPVALIAGGRQSSKGKWPWNVGIYEADPPGSNNFIHICGGTLISKNALVTAGHCVTYYQTNQAKNTRDLYVFLGKFNRTFANNDDTVQTRRVEKIDVHPDYNYINLESDIAIMWLRKEAVITPFVHPVCLPREDDDPEVGASGTLAGWGSIGDKVYPEELQETELPVVSNPTCRESHGALRNLVRKTTFCAGYRNGTSACDGDSGGGLVFNVEGGKWSVLGVVSGGVPRTGGRGCDPKHYVAFTKVNAFRSWIDRKLDQFAKKR